MLAGSYSQNKLMLSSARGNGDIEIGKSWDFSAADIGKVQFCRGSPEEHC